MDGLYGTIVSSAGEDLIEERFIDAVSRNLERGRFLLLLIGDGIQLGTENIASFLQQHAGMHFTLGLVELAIFELPSKIGGFLVQPRILARTKNIDRGVIAIANGKIIAKPPPSERFAQTDDHQRGKVLRRISEKISSPRIAPEGVHWSAGTTWCRPRF